VDSIGHRRLCFESAFAFPEQAARFRPRSIESREIDEFFLTRATSSRMDERLRRTIATSANRDTERLLGEPVPHTANQHQAAESKNHHGQTTTLWNNREGISLAGRGTPRCAVSARQVHAGHSPWNETWRCDDVPYFLWNHYSRAHCFASSLAHHPSRRTSQFASSLATAGVRGGALAALWARSCDYDDGLDICVRAWLVDPAVLCDPSPDVADRRLAARKFDREVARDQGMGVITSSARARSVGGTVRPRAASVHAWRFSA
jgi:hypothetical protein